MNTNSPVSVVVYRITGRQLFFTVPNRVCEECDLTVAIVRQAVEHVGVADARLTVKPWLNSLLEPLIRGGWHPPIVTVNGRVITQGIVPSKLAVEDAILKAAGIATPSPQ